MRSGGSRRRRNPLRRCLARRNSDQGCRVVRGACCMLSMKDKVAIVTGAGSVGPGWGNGKATATLLARQGASVFLVDINPEAAAETRGIISGEGGTCAVHRADMMVSADVAELVQACIDRFRRLDILVNNVGGSAPGDP